MVFIMYACSLVAWPLDDWIDYGGVEDDRASLKFVIPFIFFNNHVTSL